MKKCWCGRKMIPVEVEGICSSAWWWGCPKHGHFDYICTLPKGQKPTEAKRRAK